MVPVMVLGTIIGGKRYSVLEYVCAGLIGGGISLFAAQSMSGASQKLSSPNAPLGYTLCAVNLILDGYTNAAQDKIHGQYKGTSSLVTMCWMNFWCSLYNAAFLFVFSKVRGETAGRRSHDNAQYNPEQGLQCVGIQRRRLDAKDYTFRAHPDLDARATAVRRSSCGGTVQPRHHRRNGIRDRAVPLAVR